MAAKTYPGAKTNSGIIAFLVNEIPHHDRYFELCAGSAQLFRNKKRAAYNHLNDINPLVIGELFSSFGHEKETIRYSTLPLNELLPHFSFSRRDFLYLDPPYLDPPYPASARRSGAAIYEHEMLSEDMHADLLARLLPLDANIMISTSPNDLYDQVLKGWRKESFETMGRRGKRTELIYMNYDKPTYLHQYDMLGSDCWDRQGVSRKRNRFVEKINRLDPYQRHIFIQELINSDQSAVQHFVSVLASDKK